MFKKGLKIQAFIMVLKLLFHSPNFPNFQKKNFPQFPYLGQACCCIGHALGGSQPVFKLNKKIMNFNFFEKIFSIGKFELKPAKISTKKFPKFPKSDLLGPECDFGGVVGASVGGVAHDGAGRVSDLDLMKNFSKFFFV